MEKWSFSVASDVALARGGVVPCESEASAAILFGHGGWCVGASFRGAAAKVSLVLLFDLWKIWSGREEVVILEMGEPT